MIPDNNLQACRISSPAHANYYHGDQVSVRPAGGDLQVREGGGRDHGALLQEGVHCRQEAGGVGLALLKRKLPFKTWLYFIFKENCFNLLP